MMGRYRFLGEQGYGVYEVSLDEGFSAERVDKAADRLLVPGFVDLHFHGAYGLDFMSSTTHDLLFLAGKLDREGYEAVLPTTVAASLDEVLMAIGQLPDHPMFPGFHLEGPFISREYPGAQPQSAILDVPLGPSLWDEVFDHPLLRVITLAAEYPHALPLATRLMTRGVIVSQGHTAATFSEARAGFQCGAFHVTHMFNAMRPFHHREPGIVGYALVTDGMSVEIIYDRQHVAADAMRLIIQCKNPDDILAVSDSSAATRLPDGSRVRMWGHEAVVEGKAVRLADGTLAGSTITLRDAFKNLAQDFGEELAIRACCLNPRRALKLGPPKKYLEFDEGFNLVQIHQLT
jgi:N-acetylglucosamine-6-phosphate deacetylase